MQFVKKFFSGFVTFTTILSSVFVGTLSFAGAASAATTDGDLIKASGPAVYYYAGSKRYVFPNEKTYFSWFADFSTVKTITDGELAAVMIGGNVTIRPGTKLVKITTDPKVYAVTFGGVLHWVETEAIMTALYGANWNKMIVDVPDGFFVNYTVGSSVSTAVHPDGTLITYAGDPTKYIVMGGQKRKFAADAVFAANGLNSANVITTTISYPNGTDVTTREPLIANVINVGQGGPVVGGNLSIALASDTPAGTSLPKGGASIQLVKVNLTAGSADAVVTGMKFHRVGVGATTDFANVYLYDANGTRLTTGRSINSSSNLAEFNSINLTIPAGQTKAVVLYGDVAAAGTATAGGQHSFEVMDAASVVITGSGTVSGSFPVRGNVFTIGTTSASALTVTLGTAVANPNVGAKGAEIANFKLTAGANDIEVRRVTLIQAGSITNTDLSNLVLKQGTSPVAQSASLTGDKIVLTFNPAYLLSNGTSKNFSLVADIAGRSARTIKIYNEFSTDVYAVDKTYGTGAAVDVTGYDGTDAAANCTNNITCADSSLSTTQGGQLTVSFNGPTTQNVAKGTTLVPLYKFSLASADNDLEIKQLKFTIKSIAGNGGLVKGNGSTEYFKNIRIVNLDTNTTLMGPVSMSGVAASAQTTGALGVGITMTDSFTMKAGQVLNLALESDLATTEDSDKNFFTNGTSTYVAEMGDGTNIFGATAVRIINTGEYLATTKIVPNTDNTGNPFTVKSSSLSVALASTPSSGTVTQKQSNVPSVGFVLSAGAQSDVTVTSLILTGYGSSTGAYAVGDLAKVVTSCSLWDGDAQVGTSQNPDTTAGTMNFNGLTYLVAKGTSKTLIAKCSVVSNISQTSGLTNLFNIGIAASGITAQDNQSNSVSATGLPINTTVRSVYETVIGSGTLTVATESLRPTTILVAGGDTWQNLSQYKLTAQNEDMSVDRINVTTTGDAANFSAIAIAKDGAVKGWDILPSGAFKSKDIDLSASPIVVPNGGSVSIQFWGKLSNVVSSSSVSGASAGVSRSGAAISIGLNRNIQTGEWNAQYNNQYNLRSTGAASGARIYSTSSNAALMGNTFVVRKSKPIVARQVVSSTTLASGADMELYKFSVGADPAGSIALKKVSFNISFSTSTGSTVKLSNFRIRRGTTDLALSQARIVDVIGTDLTAGNLNSGAGAPAGGASSTARVVVEFTSQESISGSGNVYTLHATVAGTVVSGDSVTTALLKTGGSTVVTGYLTSDDVTSTLGIAGPQIDTAVAPAGTQGAEGTFVWSDQSEVPHSDATGLLGGSRDWSDDVYVDDLTQSQSLSR